VVNLNALPEVYRPKALSLTRVFITSSAIVAIGLLVPLVMLVQSTAADIASLRAQLDTTNQLLKLKHVEQQAQQEQIAELEKKVAELEAAREPFTTVLSNFGRQQEIVNGDLEVATSHLTLPGSVNLSGIAHASVEFTISGMSPSETEVLVYADALRDTERFSQVIVSGVEKTEDGVSFTLTLGAREQD